MSRIIDGIVYRVKTTTGGILIEVPNELGSNKELYKTCAELSMQGHIITSVTEILPHSTSTPRVQVLSTKEYRAEVKRLMEEKK